MQVGLSRKVAYVFKWLIGLKKLDPFKREFTYSTYKLIEAQFFKATPYQYYNYAGNMLYSLNMCREILVYDTEVEWKQLISRFNIIIVNVEWVGRIKMMEFTSGTYLSVYDVVR